MLYLWKHGDEEHPQISLLLFSLAGINLVLLVFNLRNKKVLL
jgi:Zn-dependent protease